MADRNEILQFSILTIAVLVVNYNQLWMCVKSAVITLSLEMIPCRFLINTRRIIRERFFDPIFKNAFSGTEFPLVPSSTQPIRIIKFIAAFFAYSLLSCPLRETKTFDRAKIPSVPVMVVVTKKYFFAMMADISDSLEFFPSTQSHINQFYP